MRSILYIGMALLMAGCQSDDNWNGTLSGGEKTPLVLEPTLSAQRALTRATDGTFTDGDQLLVYIRHTTGGEKGNYTTVAADQAPKLVSFEFKANESPALYWDDFSNSIAETTDLRTEGHALQTYYGYCYNGGTPTTALEETTGVLGWTISKEQTSAEVVQHADLLWSAEQEAVAYSHTSTNGLSVPFAHAMSEVTVTITTDDTFGTTPLTNTALTLNSMNTVATVNAPAGTIESSTPENITMCGAAYTSGDTRTFTAIVAPGTPLNVGDKLLNIVDVEGNNYTLTITDDMLKATAWAKEGYDANQTAIATQSGVNYHLDVNVSKTAIALQATLKDWTTVVANGTGDIAFDNDIVNFTVEGTAFEDGSSFRLYWKDASFTTEYGLATTSTLTAGEWTNSPVIYWPNGKDQYFFRALSGNTKDLEVKQNEDVLWGTTAQHNDIKAGAAIKPRTGNVPLIFEHAMAKIQFVLETATSGNAVVDLTSATIAVDTIYTSGIINLEDGSITTATATTNVAIPSLAPKTDEIVIPQTINDKAVVIITLKDGTKYKLQLNQCADKDGAKITTWERGKSYTYTIHLEKEEMKFRAVIKAWDEKQGSGDATLDWD